MQYLTKLSTSPTEPIDLADMQNYLRVDPGGPDQSRIAKLITSARRWAERYESRALVTEQYLLRIDHFPYFFALSGTLIFDQMPEWEGFWGTPFGLLNFDARRFAIELPVGPLVSIDAFTYLDTTGTSQTLAPSAYQSVTADDVSPLLFPADNTYWPATIFDPAAVSITFTAGMIPENDTIVAIQMMVAAAFDDPSGQQPIPQAAKSYLQRAYKV